MAGDDVAAEFVADLQRALEIELVPLAQCFAVVMPSVSAAASTSNQVLPPSTPEATTVRQTPLQAIEAPSAMVRDRSGRRCAGDATAPAPSA